MRHQKWLKPCRSFFVAASALLLSVAAQATEATAQKTDRIISADAGATALLRDFGVAQQLVGIDVTSPQSEKEKLPVVGYHRQLAAEGLLALRPTVLIGSEHMGPASTLTAVEAAGVKVVRLPAVSDGAGLLSNIRLLAKTMNEPAQAQTVVQQVEKKIADLQKNALPKSSRALFLLSAGSRGLRAAGVGTGGDALIRLLGANNVMSHNSYQPISAEAIMAANPDVILLAADGGQNTTDNLLKDYPTLAAMTVAKNGKILAVRSETLVAGLSVLTVDEALRLQALLQQKTAKPE